MKRIFKFLLCFVVILGFVGSANAKPFANPIEKAIKKSDISDSAFISVSFKDIKNGKTAFEMNSNAPMSPASTQKLVTMIPSFNILGSDYFFKTQLYKNKNNNLYLKLGADPYLTSNDLKGMIKTLIAHKIYTTKAFYIDDSILDSNEWGEGWQWDNDMNPLMPKFGSYNLDKNLLTVNVCPTQMGAPADISLDVFYPTAFMNNIVTGTTTDVHLDRRNYISPDVINANGTVSHDYAMQIPVNYPRRYFILRLEALMRQQKFSYYGDFNRLKLPKNLYIVSEVKHPLSQVADEILKNSNNMMAETVFKVAGGKYAKETGSSEAAIDMFRSYYKKLGINVDNQKIVDGSGVSKNNLITSDFMTEVLLKESRNKNFDDFKEHMASPGEGTLRDRMLYFKNNLKAKTGTLTNVSSIAGYLTAKNGRTYAFCIMINDPKSKSADKKAFEEYVLREAFASL